MLAVVLGCSSLIPRGGNLFEGDNAAIAAAAIKKKVGTAKVRVIRGEIRPNVMKLVIQSEANPKDQDEYTYERGSVTGPEPVKIHKVFADNVHYRNRGKGPNIWPTRLERPLNWSQWTPNMPRPPIRG